MDLIHFILNAAAMLLWLSWRSHRFVPANDFRGGTLLSTLKKTERGQFNRKTLVTSLVTLLGLRAIFYWHIGTGVNWAPRMDFVVISIPYRCDFFDRMLLFSVLSFGCWLGIFAFAMLFLQLLNHRTGETNPWQAIVKKHLGIVSDLPIGVRIFLPALTAFVLWLVLSYYLSYLLILELPGSWQHWVGQALVLAVTVHLLCTPLILAVMLLHMVNSYVYLGNYAFLAYINTTAQTLLKLIRRLPLRLGKIDLAPLVFSAIVLGLDIILRRGLGEEHRYSLLWFFQHFMI